MGNALSGATVLLLSLAALGCDLATLGPNSDIEGVYAYGGTVDNAPGYSVVGELVIARQYRDDADIYVDWYLLYGPTVVTAVERQRASARLDSSGRLRFEVDGELRLENGGWVRYALEHDARSYGHTLRGTWVLRTDGYPTERGDFTAAR